MWPSFVSFGKVVSEKKIFKEKLTTDDGRKVVAKAHPGIARWAKNDMLRLCLRYICYQQSESRLLLQVEVVILLSNKSCWSKIWLHTTFFFVFWHWSLWFHLNPKAYNSWWGKTDGKVKFSPFIQEGKIIPILLGGKTRSPRSNQSPRKNRHWGKWL